ncbi:MAG: IGHMBP2 family helicase [Persephonella sp.]|nr:MAG: IGHMBP2 family helicase [Persephonella sp.]
MKKIFENRTEYRLYWEELIELERNAEKNFHLEEILKLNGEERERRGRAIIDLKAKYVGEIIGEFYLYRFFRENFPDHQINVGDVVLVSRKSPLKDGIEGTVFEKGKNFLTIAFSSLLPKGKKWRIDLFVNDITFKRMLGSLEFFEKGYSLYDDNIVLGKKQPDVKEEDIEQFFNENLNQYQREAVRKAVGSKELFLIHGPPGTGKTTTLIEVILQSLKKGEKILATADSNTAVDNIVEGLLKFNVNIVRLGHPARLKKELLDVSIDAKALKHPKYSEIEKLNKKINKFLSLQEGYLKPTPSRRRGLTDNQIFKYAKSGKSVRGVSKESIKSMAEWIRLQREIKKLREQKRRIEQEITEDILSNSDVICATNSSAGSEYLMDKYFDTLFIDEASQSTEPSCLIPLIKVSKVVMAGDHKQLPPVVLHPLAKGLSYTMFERFIDLYPENSYMLKIQYRMNEVINRFPSNKFYEGKLISAEDVKDRKLSDIVKVDENSPITDDTPIVFVDTLGEFTEERKKASQSKFNPKEADLVKRIVDSLKSLGLSVEDIGIITPYKDHEEYLKSLIPDVEVKTVDGFQGREKEVIIISLVRSNPKENIGFLDDFRRLNVALTRAKRKLIIVGDEKTLTSNQTYKELIDYIKKYGKRITKDNIKNE